MTVGARGRQQPQLGEHGRRHFLGLVAAQRRVMVAARDPRSGLRGEERRDRGRARPGVR
jgi:hypothetical protein